jgi:hypothetical protein
MVIGLKNNCPCVKWGGDGRREGHEKSIWIFQFYGLKKPILLKHANLVPSEFAPTSNFYSIKLVYACNTNDIPTYRDVTSDFSTVYL